MNMEKNNPLEESPITERSKFIVAAEGSKDSIYANILCPEIIVNPKTISSKDCENGEEGTVGTGSISSAIDEQNKAKKRIFSRRYAGIFLSLFSALVFTLGALIVKFMKGYHPFTLGVYRFQGILLPSIPFLVYAKCVKKEQVFEPMWPLTNRENLKTFVFLGLRGLMGWFALIFHFYALQYLNIADAMIIGSCKPVVVSIIAHIFLREKCGVFPIFVAALTVFGVGIILRPPILTGKSFEHDLMVGAGFAFGGVLSSSLSMAVVRRLRKVHFAVVTLVFGSWGTALCLILALSFGVLAYPRGTHDLLFAVALAVVTFLVQSSFTLALKFEQAGPVSLIRTSESVFAFIWQYIFLGIEPDVYSLAGAAIVIVAVGLTVWRKSIEGLSEDHPRRKRYSFILK